MSRPLHDAGAVGAAGSMAGDSRFLSLTPRAARVVLVLAACAFAVQGWFLADMNATWHEEGATHAAPPPLQLTMESSGPRVSGICDGGAWIVATGQRPQIVLCAGGLAWPVLVMPYIAGMPYWPFQLLRPLHHGHPVALRRVALSIGVLALVVLFLFVERIGDPSRAATTVAIAAVAPFFVILHSLLVTFEVVPPLLIACAALIVVRRPSPQLPPGVRRAAAAGACAGLAILANVKAVVVGLPLLAFALYESPALRRTSRRAWLSAGLAVAVVLAPFAVAALADPGSRFGFEVNRRFGIAASRLDPRLLVAEALNGIVFATDIAFYTDIVSGEGNRLVPLTLVLAACAFLYSSAELVRALRRRPHDPVAAGCGAIQLFFLVFVWLAYNQTPAANYSPVIYVYAVSMGCTLVAGGAWTVRRFGHPRLTVAALGAIVFLSLPWNTYRRGDPRNFQTLSTNLAAVRALGTYLQRVPGGTVVVTSYNLAGVPDGLSGQPSLNIDRQLEQCASAPDAEACEQDVVAAVISALPQPRFLTPLWRSVVDKPSAWRAAETVEKAAQKLGFHAREEARFATGRGIDVLALYAIERNAAVPDLAQ